jgi:hypothetical protein
LLVNLSKTTGFTLASKLLGRESSNESVLILHKEFVLLVTVRKRILAKLDNNNIWILLLLLRGSVIEEIGNVLLEQLFNLPDLNFLNFLSFRVGFYSLEFMVGIHV